MPRAFASRRRLTVLVFVTAACGGSDGHGTPTNPPPPPIVASVRISPASATMGVATTQQLSVAAFTTAGDSLASPSVTWSSSNPSDIAVSATGVLTALAIGSATITATVGSVSGTASATVTNGGTGTTGGTTSAARTLSIAPSPYTLASGDSVQLTASYVVDGVAQPTPGLVWTSSDTVNVRVSRYGRVISDGPATTATITAKLDSLTATATVTVQRVTKNLPRIAYEVDVSVPALDYEQVRRVYVDGTNDSRVTPPLQPVLGWDVAPNAPTIAVMYGSGSLNGGPFYGKIGGFVVPIDNYAETPLADIMGAPAWSPDARQIAFVASQPSGEADLGVVNADGSGSRLLTTQPGAVGPPAWAPDGHHIVSTHAVAGGGSVQLWITDMSGVTQPITTTATTPSRPVWSPDGARIAFDDGRDIWVMNADGTQQTRITDTCAAPSPCDFSTAATYPTWSPDGTEIAYGTSSAIVIIRPDGTAVRRIAVSGMLSGAKAWSSDGTMLLFRAQQSATAGWPSAWVVDQAGTNPHPVTTGRNVMVVHWIRSGS